MQQIREQLFDPAQKFIFKRLPSLLPEPVRQQILGKFKWTVSQVMRKRDIYNGKESSATLSLMSRALESSATLSLMSRALSDVLVCAETFAFQCVKNNEGLCSDSPAVSNANPSHRIYSVQAIFCEKLFREFEDPSFGLETGNTSSSYHTPDWYFQEFQKFYYPKPDEPLEDPNFDKYVRDCTSELVFPEGKSEDLFLNLLKAIWALHKLAFSFIPEAKIFRVKSGERFQASRMEQVFVQEDEMETINFMVWPGFEIGNHIFKARVYSCAGNTAV